MTSTMRFDRWENPAATQSVTFNQLVGGTGLVPMIPTSISHTGTSATYSTTTGKITFTSITDLKINGIFTPAYDRYKIVFGLKTSASLTLRTRVCAGGTAKTGTFYAWSGQAWINGTGSAYAGSGTDWNAFVDNANSTSVSADFDIINPQDSTQITRVNGTVGAFTTGWFYAVFGSAYNAVDLIDGFNIYSTSANSVTGWAMVYGYKD